MTKNMLHGTEAFIIPWKEEFFRVLLFALILAMVGLSFSPCVEYKEWDRSHGFTSLLDQPPDKSHTSSFHPLMFCIFSAIELLYLCTKKKPVKAILGLLAHLGKAGWLIFIQYVGALAALSLGSPDYIVAPPITAHEYLPLFYVLWVLFFFTAIVYVFYFFSLCATKRREQQMEENPL